ncbi:MAG: thermonuclease family protein [Gallionella sp.]
MLPMRLLFAVVCLMTEAHAEQFTARIIAVLDGDTVMLVRNDMPPIKIRLAEIDAPEMAQPGGVDAKRALSEMLLHKSVAVDSHAVDQYGRLVAHLNVDGKQVNELMVSSGMAWEYSHFHRNTHYVALQIKAQAARRGIWRQTAPLPPWQWRKLHAAEFQKNTPHGTMVPMPDSGVYICGNKHRCSEMNSCDEAYFFFVHCNVKALDSNRDGVPCEKLCISK